MSDKHMEVLGEQIVREVCGISDALVSVRANPQSAEENFYLVGSDVIGAGLTVSKRAPVGRSAGGVGAPSAGRNAPAYAGDPKKISKPPKAKFDYVKAPKIAQNAAARAKNVGEAAIARASRYTPAKVLPLPPTKVKGLVDVILGVLGGTAAARAKSAADKYLTLNKKHADAAKKSETAGKKAVEAGKKLAETTKKVGPVLVKMTQKRMTVVHGTEVLGFDGEVNDNGATAAELFQAAWPEIVGESVSPKSVPVHNAAFWPEVVGTDVNDEGQAIWPEIIGDDEYAPDAFTDVPVDTSNQYDIEALPPGGEKMSDADAWIPQRKVPGDGVVYGGELGVPRYWFGSAAYFFGRQVDNHGKEQDGYIWGWNAMLQGGDTTPRWILAKWSSVKGRDSSWEESGVPWNMEPQTTAQIDQMSRSANPPLGPLIGNPNVSEIRGLQWAIDDKKWFWQAKYAPDWATREARAAADLLKKQTEAANKAAADAEAARLAAEQAAIDEAQAKQDAENALIASKADAEAYAASQVQQTEQAKFDLEMQRSQMELAKAQAQADIEAQKSYDAWAASHPEEAYAPAPVYDGGGGYGSSDEAALQQGIDPFAQPDEGDADLEYQASLQPPPGEVPEDEE